MEEGRIEPVWEDNLLKGLGKFTWPGIELGHSPQFRHSFFEYVDALRGGDVRLFKELEAESGEWWNASMDRGRGACLHFAAEHGQLKAVCFLIEERAVHVNQQDLDQGLTPLHRCARMAHYTHQPYFEVCEYLLERGADPDIKTNDGKAILDLVVEQGRGWEKGEVKAKLKGLFDKYAQVQKEPAFTYTGPPIGPEAQALLEAWEQLPVKVPPPNWRAPPPAGFQGAQGIRLAAAEPWRPAGENDGSCYVRPMTDAELEAQSKQAQAA